MTIKTLEYCISLLSITPSSRQRYKVPFHESVRQSNSHCDWEDIAGRCDRHASAEHHLLTVAVQYTIVWVPGYRQGESDVYFFMGFPTYIEKHAKMQWEYTRSLLNLHVDFPRRKRNPLFNHREMFLDRLIFLTTINIIQTCHVDSNSNNYLQLAMIRLKQPTHLGRVTA